jgi:hypothetical protein
MSPDTSLPPSSVTKGDVQVTETTGLKNKLKATFEIEQC